ncbi:MAG TPA: hypothetical protein VF111_11415, partial [Thermoanaerobaculia bacterium]
VLIALMVFLLAAACAITSQYDPALDRDIVALRDRVDGFLVQLEGKAGTAEGVYALHQPFYDELWIALDALGGRGGKTGAALTALAENLRRLESLHRQGLTRAEVPVLRKILGVQFDGLCQQAAKGRG